MVGVVYLAVVSFSLVVAQTNLAETKVSLITAEAILAVARVLE